MKLRKFGNTHKMVSEIGLGTQQLGIKWTDKFNKDEAFKILNSAYENGINFIDTADVYNNGLSEITIGEKAVAFSTSWISKHLVSLIKKNLRNKGIDVVDEYIYYKNKPSEKDLNEVEDIVKRIVSECK